MTTKADCARKIAAFLASVVSHEELVKWADTALAEEDFPEADGRLLLGVLSDLSASRVGAYVSQIGDYHAFLRELGFRMEPHLVTAESRSTSASVQRRRPKKSVTKATKENPHPAFGHPLPHPRARAVKTNDRFSIIENLPFAIGQ
jgi:hypothetical protein